MREWIKLSMPKEPAFLKANQPLDGGAIPSQAHKDGLRGGELSHTFHVILGLSSVEVRGGFPHPPIVLEEIEAEARPSNMVLSLNQFGRGQQVSSFQCSSVSTGWKPKSFQWRLLGGGNARKKLGPKTKAGESREGN